MASIYCDTARGSAPGSARTSRVQKLSTRRTRLYLFETKNSCIFNHGWTPINTDFSKPVRAGIFIAPSGTNGQSSVRSDIQVNGINAKAQSGDYQMMFCVFALNIYAAPDGAEICFGFGFYKYAAPDGAGDGRAASPLVAADC